MGWCASIEIKQMEHVTMLTRGKRLTRLIVDTRGLSLSRRYAVIGNKAKPELTSSVEDEVEDASQPKKSARWKIVSSVCLARFPKLTRPKTELQLQFEAVQEQLRLERSRLSDYELEEIKIKEIMEEIARRAKMDELVDDQTASAPEKFQEAAALRNKMLAEFLPGPRITKADEEKDLHSLDRKLDHMLYLIVKNREPLNTWQMPQGDYKGEEALIEAAKRQLAEECGSELIPLFLSRSPCAYMAYHFAHPGYNEIGAKVFFFKAQLKGGKIKINPDKLEDYAWVTKEEMKEFVSKDFYKAVEPVLLD